MANPIITSDASPGPQPRGRSAEHRRTLDIRFEAFNVLNRTQFNLSATSTAASALNLSDVANFGLVRAQQKAPRAMQFAAKFNW